MNSQGIIDALSIRLADRFDARKPQLSPVTPIPNGKRWSPMRITLPDGGSLVVELPEYINGYGSHLPSATDKALTAGREALSSLFVPSTTPEWSRDGEAWVMDVSCGPKLHIAYRVESASGRVDVACDLTNNTGGTLERVIQFLCCAVSQDSFYFSRDPLTTHFLYNGKYVTWTALTDLGVIWREGMAVDEGVHWLEAPVKGSGRILRPYPRRAVVQGEVDCGIIVQDHKSEPYWTMILAGEPGGSIFKNCNGGCIHVNPAHGTVPQGATSRIHLAILFCQTTDMAADLQAVIDSSSK